jgi:hypothetical protein
MNPDEKKRITIVVPLDVWAALRDIAKAHGRSLVQEIIWALRQYIEQHTD